MKPYIAGGCDLLEYSLVKRGYVAEYIWLQDYQVPAQIRQQPQPITDTRGTTNYGERY